MLIRLPYLTALTLCLALLTQPASADDNPLLFELPDHSCQLNANASLVEEELLSCIRQAELGRAQAQYELGNYWYRGVLTTQDFEKAMHWYSQASLQGHALSQLQLGKMYANGEGVAVNRAQAFIILKMSAINGSDEAMDAADLLQQTMEERELEQANQALSQIFRRYLQHIQQQLLDEEITPSGDTQDANIR